MKPQLRSLSLALALGILAPFASAQEDPVLLVQSTTSTQNSGLYEHLLPLAQEALGLDIRVVAVGTGQALRNAQNCDGDLLITHAPEAEQDFISAGYGLARHDLMYNDFVLIGPGEDPAGVAGSADISQALSRIAASSAAFASRGDDSGTHRREVALWAGIVEPDQVSGSWYRETGSGMGATLNLAIGMGAYTLSDRATWLGFENRASHRILHQGDADLFNQYAVVMLNPAHCPNANMHAAQAFADWLLGAEGQEAIDAFEIDGQQLFFANGASPEAAP